MLIFIPRLEFRGDRKRKIDFLLSFSLRCSRFLSRYTRHDSPSLSPSSSSPIPRLSDSQPFVNTTVQLRLEPNQSVQNSTAFYGQRQLIVNLIGPCITLTVLTRYTPLPSPNVEKSFRKAVSLDYFLLSSPSRDKNFRVHR